MVSALGRLVGSVAATTVSAGGREVQRRAATAPATEAASSPATAIRGHVRCEVGAVEGSERGEGDMRREYTVGSTRRAQCPTRRAANAPGLAASRVEGASRPNLSPVPPPPPAGLFARLLAAVRRASSAIYRTIVLALLAVTYVIVLPWFFVARRLFGAPPPGGWRLRDDRDLASIERLRSHF